MVVIQSDFRSAVQMAGKFGYFRQNQFIASRCLSRAALLRPFARALPSWPTSLRWRVSVRAFSTPGTEAQVKIVTDKPSLCTADELHYVSVSNSDWKLALWRYNPPPQAPSRNHPLLLLSGVGTNAIGYDLSPDSSFARHMSGQGFDTWVLEVRGAGLSMQESDPRKIEQSANAMSEKIEATANTATNEAFSSEQQSTITPRSNSSAESNISAAKEEKGIATAWDESKLVTKLTETFMLLSERLSGFLSEGQSKIMSAKLLDQISKLLEDSQLFDRFTEIRGKLTNLLEAGENYAIAGQIRDLSERLVNIIDDGQRSVSPPLFDLQERVLATIEDFQKQIELIVKYDWDFDHYLEEDVPAVVRWSI